MLYLFLNFVLPCRRDKTVVLLLYHILLCTVSKITRAAHALFRWSIRELPLRRDSLPEQRNLEVQPWIWTEAVAGAQGALHTIPVCIARVSVILHHLDTAGPSWTSNLWTGYSCFRRLPMKSMRWVDRQATCSACSPIFSGGHPSLPARGVLSSHKQSTT